MEQFARAVKEHALENSVDEASIWKRVEAYIDEIVPFFNILTYYKLGLAVSRVLLNFLQGFSRVCGAARQRDRLPAVRGFSV
jgi:hypothetical protein